ncbi:TVP38/TMEM64 family protein [Chelativorans salis]|uniref:TVP38/TMEM64 family membrane protein n=1 Tax=Chelativorans salis TaxID=2978478 RepID=A0ABT2LHK9_9HYPH|nr:TVP38/TMEM64 family protein [Chelativorans sp. EGI FJ00035]MCT7373928.1 TVP38/TMEM64 family protein [Chelativorans sp. EGI FJ00035]
MAGEKTDPERRLILWRFAPLAFVIVALLLGYAMGWHRYLTLDALADSREMLKAYVAAHPLLAPAVFALVYVATVAASFPAASLLTVAAGFLFGWLLGGMLVVVAATAGATLLFLAARTALGDVLRRWMCGRTARLAQGFEEGAFGYLLVLRLAPIFPFWIINIAPAFFNVRLKTYVAATALGIMPATFAYAYLGHGLDSVLMSAARSGRDLALADLVTPQLTVAFAALAVVAAIPLIIRKVRGKRLS